jgi:hypothetical protein
LFTNVSAEHALSILRIEINVEDGSNMFFRNVVIQPELHGATNQKITIKIHITVNSPILYLGKFPLGI